MKALPSQERLKELFDYQPTTGAFTRKKNHRQTRPRKDGYRQMGVDYDQFLEHRLIYKWMTGQEPKFIDHINRDRADNRWSNLREASYEQNSGNKLWSGVVYDPSLTKNKWKARLRSKHIGVFSTEIEARQAYEQAHAKHFKHFSPYYTDDRPTD